MKTSDFILPFLLIAIILTLIKFSQVASRKLKLPDVLGELVVGIILGPTVLGILFLSPEPSSSLSLFLNIDQNHLDLTASIITFISDLAILLLLFKVGIEVDFFLFLWCQLLITIFGLRKQVKVKYGDFFKKDLMGADVIICFLWPSTNNRLEHKLAKELKPTARIVSNKYIFQGFKLIKKDEKDEIYVYSTEKII